MRSTNGLPSSARESPLAGSSMMEPVVFHPTHEEVETLAYSLWEEQSKVDGHAKEDWSKAAQELPAPGPSASGR
jgi:hypothetical protein